MVSQIKHLIYTPLLFLLLSLCLRVSATSIGAGWHLVSGNGQSVEQFFSKYPGTAILIWGYSDGSWSWAAQGEVRNSINTWLQSQSDDYPALTQLQQGQGYWVSASATIELSSAETSTPTTYGPGWHLISGNDQSLDDFYAQHPEVSAVIHHSGANGWLARDPRNLVYPKYRGLETLEKGKGYWAKVGDPPTRMIPDFNLTKSHQKELFIVYKDHVQLGDLSEVLGELDISPLQSADDTVAEKVGAYELKEGDAQDAAQRLRDKNIVEFVVPNYKMEFGANPPNDEYFNQQPNLVSDIAASIDLLGAWDLYAKRKEVTVAVIDSGVQVNHEDLQGSLWVNEAEANGITGVDDDNNGFVDDIHGYNFVGAGDNNPMDEIGHGTHCAGVIGARSNNNIGIAGIAPVRIMALRYCGRADICYQRDAIEAFNYAINNGADIISFSSIGTQFNPVFKGIIQKAKDRGVLVVSAAGNSGRKLKAHHDFFPINYRMPDTANANGVELRYDNIISVGAIDQNGNLASFSNYGRQMVDLLAPGVDILSTWFTQDGYSQQSGTSMAVPHVSAVAALLKSMRPDLTPQQIKTILMDTIKSSPEDEIKHSKAGGYLNAAQAMAFLAGQAPVPAIISGSLFLKGDPLTMNASSSYHPNSSQGSSITTYTWLVQKDGNNFRELLYQGPLTEFTTDQLEPGSYELILQVTDQFEAIGESRKNIRIHENPTAVVTPLPSILNLAENISFDGSQSYDEADGSGNIILYEWSSSLNGFLSNQASFETTSLSLGTHTIQFKITDSDFKSSQLFFEVQIKEPLLDPPANLQVSADRGELLINWSEVLGSQSYFVYYTTTTANPRFAGVQVASASNSIVITGLSEHYAYLVGVTAFNGEYESVISDLASVAVGDLKDLGPPKDIFIENTYSIEMIRISSGVFTMGSPDEEVDRNVNEGPTNEVIITNDFFMGKYEITQGQWQAVMDDEAWPENQPSATIGISTSHPAYYMSWQDITRQDGFLDRLNESAGCDTSTLTTGPTRYHPATVPAGCYRLPTEAEWEYAARAGSSTRFSYGDDLGYVQLNEYSWYDGNTKSLGFTHPDYGSHPVGQKRANLYGLHDMHGNVFEWVYDLSAEYAFSGLLENPTGPTAGTNRVLRGGSWLFAPKQHRSAARASSAPDNRTNSALGFRIVGVVEQGISSLPPLKPQTPSSIGGDHYSSLDWPAVDTASSYRIYYSTNSMLSTSSAYVTTSATSVVITSLSNGLVHYFAVEAKNLWGSSPFSDLTSALPNALPIANDDAFILDNKYQSIDLTVLTNDSDSDDHSLSIINIKDVSRGTAVINTNSNSITVSRSNDSSSSLSFIYTISDGYGGTSTAMVNCFFDWNKKLEGSVTAITKTSDGGFAMALSSDHLIKIDSSGNTIWTTTLSSFSTPSSDFSRLWSEDFSYPSIAELSSGELIIAGSRTSSDNNQLEFIGSNDIWVAKFNQKGSLIWQRLYGGSNIDRFAKLTSTDNGGFLVVGNTRSKDGHLSDRVDSYNSLPWLIKLNAEGAIEWHKIIDNYNMVEVFDVAVTSNNNILITGYISDGMFLHKLDENGGTVWETIWGISHIESAYVQRGSSVIETSDEGAIVNVNIENWNTGLRQGVLLKFDHLGELVWETRADHVQNNQLKSVIELEDTSILAAGYRDNDNTFNDEDLDWWMIQVDANGQIIWEDTVDVGPRSLAWNILENTNNSYLIAGAGDDFEVLNFHKLPEYNSSSVEFTVLNKYPVASDDWDITNVNQAISVAPLSNDTDPDNDSLSILSIAALSVGTATISTDNQSILITPALDSSTPVTFSYMISDSKGGTDTAYYKLEINNYPITVNDSAITNINKSISVSPLANDTDPDNDLLTLMSILEISEGNAVISSDTNSLFITPAVDSSNPVTLTYLVSDGRGATTSAYFELHINSPPIANDDAAITLEEQTLVMQVLENDSDAESHALSITAVFNVVGGSASIINSGTAISVTPASDSTALVSLSYSIEDSYLATAVANVFVTVNAVNDPPTAVDDSSVTNEDTTTVVHLLLNDSDIDGGFLTIASIADVSGGSVVVLTGSTTVAVLPSLNSTSPVIFSYTLTDGQGGSSIATATVNVIPVNDDPVGFDDAFVTNEDTSLIVDVLANDTDLDSYSLTVSEVNMISGGSASITSGSTSISVTPSPDLTTELSLTYTVTDGQGGFDTAQVVVSINAVNDAPQATADSAITQINQPILLDVLANDIDVDNDPLSVFEVFNDSGFGVQITTDASAVLITPSTDSTNSINFTYTVTDGYGGFDSADVNVATMKVLERWADPIFSIEMIRISSGSFTMGSTSTEVGRDSDEGPQHSVHISTDFYIGKYEISQSQWQEVMGENPWPADSPTLTYGLSPAHPAYNISYEDITKVGGFLDKINEASGCDISSLTTSEARYLPSDVPAGCYRLPTESEWEYAARAGTTTRFSFGNDDGYFSLWYYGWYRDNSSILGSSHEDYGTQAAEQKLPNPWGLYDMHGNTFEWVYDYYSAYDSTPKTDPSGPVSGTNRAIRSGAWGSFNKHTRSSGRDSRTAQFRSLDIGLRLLKIPTNQEHLLPAVSSSLIASALETGVHLTWAEVADATGYKIFHALHTPVTSFDSYKYSTSTQTVITGVPRDILRYFTVQAVNSHGAGELSAETSVIPLNEPPKAYADTGYTFMNENLTLDVLANDTDLEGDSLSISAVSTVSGGAVQISSDGLTLLILPSVDSYESVIFSYSVTDGFGGSASASVNVTVNAKPQTNYDYLSIDEDTPTVLDILDNDVDINGGDIRILGVSNISGGSVEITTGSTSVFVSPPLDSNESISFSYSVTDSQGGTDTADVVVSINAINDAPVARDNFAHTEMNQEVTISVLDNDSDVEYDLLTITDVQILSGGTADITLSGTAIKATPYFSSNDSISIIYTISDGNGGIATANLEIAVADIITSQYGIAMMDISSGTFLMGSLDTDPYHENREKPQHQVTISKDFYMGKYEVTQGQWEAVMGEDAWPENQPSNPHLENQPSARLGIGTSHPAYYISWNDITNVGGFLDKLNEASGCDISTLPTDSTRYHPANVPSGCYRLPTEAEWEYSARAGTTTIFSHGDGEDVDRLSEGYTQLGDYAWYEGNAGFGTLDSPHPDYGVHPVGQKLSNPWGLYDMYGNVSEWTYDYAPNNFYGSTYPSSSQIDPSGPTTGDYRVIRGGYFSSNNFYLRSAYRYRLLPDENIHSESGFRLLLVQ